MSSEPNSSQPPEAPATEAGALPRGQGETAPAPREQEGSLADTHPLTPPAPAAAGLSPESEPPQVEEPQRFNKLVREFLMSAE